MTMLGDVADVQTVARPAARSPDTKAAIKYFEASGAVAISVVEVDGTVAFRIGGKIDPRAVAIFWIMQSDARAVVTLARKQNGDAVEALHQAATEKRATLTPHDTAMMRAADAAKRLDSYIEGLRARGAMREFTKAYRRHRLAAMERGEGFMTFKSAEARLRRALIPRLIGGTVGTTSSLFAEMFGG
jgi:hypothetical protein